MIKPNPFTPKSGVEPRIFLNREDEVNFFRNKIIEGKRGRFNHYVILGEWGIGKTALMKYLKNISQEEGSYCSFFTAFKFNQNIEPTYLALHLLQLITKNLPINLKEKSNFFKIIKRLGIQIAGTGFNLSFQAPEKTFIDPQILLQDGLIGLWQDVKENTELVTVLIDDVQNYCYIPEIFTLIKNVLSTDIILKETNFLFVFASTLDGWNEFLVRHHPIGRYFIPRRNLKLFSKADTKNLILEILKDSGVTFFQLVIDEIWKYTQGHLFEIHALCFALYNAQMEGKVDNKEWKVGFKAGLAYLGENVFEDMLKEASEVEKDVLFVLSLFNGMVPLEMVTKKSRELNIRPENVNTIVRRLTNKKLIRNPKRGYYLISDKLFKEYIKSTLN